LQEKFCPKCGKELPSDARFCEGCGALVDEDKPRQEDKYDRILMHLWKVLFYPLAICFVASIILYWLVTGLEYYALIGWAWIGMITPWVFFFGFWGFMAVSHQKTFHTTKEYILFSIMFLGVPIILITLTVLIFLGFLPFPTIDIEF